MSTLNPRGITDSGVFRLLTEPDEAVAARLAARVKRCSRCREEMSHTASICPRCQLYVRVSEQTWRVALQDAIRYLKSRRSR